MQACLPTAEQLMKMPSRANVAYALRASTRLVDNAAGLSDAYLTNLRDAISLARDFVQREVDFLDFASQLSVAASEVCQVELDDGFAGHKVGISVRATLRCCRYACKAALGRSEDFYVDRKKIADAAEMAARQLNDDLEHLAARDYENLVRIFDQRTRSPVGEAFDVTADGPLGPLFLR